MNQVARVFVVLNLLLAAGFLMAAATFLHQTQDWKSQYGEKDNELTAANEASAQQLAERDAEIKRLNDDLATQKGRVTELESQVADTKGRLQAADEQKNQAQRMQQQVVQTNAQNASTIGELKDRVGGLEALIDRYRTRSEEENNLRREAEVAKSEATEQLEAAKRNIDDLNGQMERLNKRLGDVNTELSNYKGAYPPPTLRNQPRVDGSVIRFDAGTNMVQVNKGRSSGIAQGHMFDIVRGDDYVGTVRITYIDDNTSVGHVEIPGLKGLSPMAGDTATKLASK